MNYIFPELAYYKPDWIPVLEAARELVRHSAVKYVCNALFVAAQSSNACGKFSTQASELSDCIEQALGGFRTVSGWFRENYPGEEHRDIGYRLAWINHMIKQCRAKHKEEEEPDDECPHCAGTGEGQYDGQSCGVCRGKGVLRK